MKINHFNRNNKMVPTEKGMHKKIVKTYEISLRNFLLTARFNTTTWTENERYRRDNPAIQSIYGSPIPLSKHIPADAVIFMLEMNNDLNRIMGIGLVRNHPITNKYFIHESGDYNRYIYTGKNRIDRETMSEEEEKVMQIFDILCFTGNRHMKRGQGLKSFPVDMLYRCSKKLDLVKFSSNPI
jgi:hypothetical protein